MIPEPCGWQPNGTHLSCTGGYCNDQGKCIPFDALPCGNTGKWCRQSEGFCGRDGICIPIGQIQCGNTSTTCPIGIPCSGYGSTWSCGTVSPTTPPPTTPPPTTPPPTTPPPATPPPATPPPATPPPTTLSAPVPAPVPSSETDFWSTTFLNLSVTWWVVIGAVVFFLFIMLALLLSKKK